MDLDPDHRLRLGVSACLLGEAVRYDGTDRRSSVITDRLGPTVVWASVCPEVEAGLGLPRESIRLEDDPENPRVRGVISGTDHTAALQGWAEQYQASLELADLDGFVLKARSPSCEPVGVTVHGRGEEIGRAPGVFAAALRRQDPLLPLCDEEDLEDPTRRRHFLERAQTRRRCRDLSGDSVGAAQVTNAGGSSEFARSHELLLIARDQDFAEIAELPRREISERLQTAMRAACTPSGHARALRRGLQRLAAVAEPPRWALAVFARDVEIGRLDPEVGRQLLRALAHSVNDPWLRRQHYLDPVPRTWRETPRSPERAAALGEGAGPAKGDDDLSQGTRR